MLRDPLTWLALSLLANVITTNTTHLLILKTARPIRVPGWAGLLGSGLYLLGLPYALLLSSVLRPRPLGLVVVASHDQLARAVALTAAMTAIILAAWLIYMTARPPGAPNSPPSRRLLSPTALTAWTPPILAHYVLSVALREAHLAFYRAVLTMELWGQHTSPAVFAALGLVGLESYANPRIRHVLASDPSGRHQLVMAACLAVLSGVVFDATGSLFLSTAAHLTAGALLPAILAR
jgi:hypothetical protein